MTDEFDADLAALAERVRRATVQVHADGRGDGSGVLWNADGTVITNAHVVGAARDVRVELHDGRSLRGVVSLRDDRLDLAEVRTASAPAGLPAAAVGPSGGLRAGDVVAALGSPLGIASALTLGIVHRAASEPDGRPRRWIEADLRLAPGNSGGPMVDARGRVVGINSMIAGGGLALAVPSERAERFVEWRGARAWLGLTTQPVAVDVPDIGFGLLVVEVAASGPAERAGVLLGDVIIGAAGRRFAWPGDLSFALDRVAPGAPLVIETLRAGSLRATNVATGSTGGAAKRAA